MTTPLLLILVSAVPLALTFAFAIRPLRPLAMAVLPLAPLLALVVALSAPMTVNLPWLGLGARFETVGLRADFLLFTTLLWSTAGAAAMIYIRDHPYRSRFCVLFLLSMAGNLGLVVAADAMSFYAFFAMMSLASWGLVLHERTEFSRFAGRTYIAFAVAGELALFAGFALAAASAGSTLLVEMAVADQPWLATALILLGFGIKLGVVPLHLWLPLAHAAAPAPASAVLSGAMIKAGLFGMAVVLPLGLVALPGPAIALIVCGALSILVAVLIGVTQTNPKAVLAYSSVGQMGLVATAIGVALAAPAAWPAIGTALALFAAHHAFAKAALFLGVPAFWSMRSAHQRILVLTALALAAAALAAAPWTSGALAKSEVSAALAAGPEDWSVWLYPILVAGSTGTTLLMTRFLVLLARQPEKTTMSRALALPWAATVVLAGAGLWLFPFEAGPLPTDPLSDLMPVAVGLALAAIVLALLRIGGIRAGEIPPGEILALFYRGSSRQSAIASLQLQQLNQSNRALLTRRIPEIGRYGGFALLCVAATLIVVGLVPLEPTLFGG